MLIPISIVMTRSRNGEEFSFERPLGLISLLLQTLVYRTRQGKGHGTSRHGIASPLLNRVRASAPLRLYRPSPSFQAAPGTQPGSGSSQQPSLQLAGGSARQFRAKRHAGGDLIASEPLGAKSQQFRFARGHANA